MVAALLCWRNSHAAETIPKLALLQRGMLPEDAKILMWGEPYELEFLELMGFQETQVGKPHDPPPSPPPLLPSQPLQTMPMQQQHYLRG